MTQKHLASVVRKENGAHISAQYLNDVEHNRRTLSSDHLIRQFAKSLDIHMDYLFALAGLLPPDIRAKVQKSREPHICAGFESFRTMLGMRP